MEGVSVKVGLGVMVWVAVGDGVGLLVGVKVGCCAKAVPVASGVWVGGIGVGSIGWRVRLQANDVTANNAMKKTNRRTV